MIHVRTGSLSGLAKNSTRHEPPMRRLCNQGTGKQAFTKRRLCVPIVSVLKRESRSAASTAQRRRLRPTQSVGRGRSRGPVSRWIRPRRLVTNRTCTQIYRFVQHHLIDQMFPRAYLLSEGSAQLGREQVWAGVWRLKAARLIRFPSDRTGEQRGRGK